MDLPETSRLYSAAIAAAKFADQRLEARTRTTTPAAFDVLQRFAVLKVPRSAEAAFIQLPAVIAAYINQLAHLTRVSGLPRSYAAISWHYTKPEMLAGGHPHDRCHMKIHAGLSKAKKRERTPKRASPMSLAMLTRIITFLETDSSFNQTMRVWFSAVCSLAFTACRRSRKNGATIKFGCFTIRDRKTDHDPLQVTYSLHHLTKDKQAAEALTYVERWLDHACTQLHHKWNNTDCLPSLTKIPRSGSKRQKISTISTTGSGTFANVGIKWGSPMSDGNFTQILNAVANAAGISKNLLGDDIWFASHCFRRGRAQYRFMFAPEKSREKAETVTRYLLDDVLDREENLLGDSLAPDAILPEKGSLKGLQDIGYNSPHSDAEIHEITDSANSEPASISASIVGDIKSALIADLREMMKQIGSNSTQSTECEDEREVESVAAKAADDALGLVSELSDAKGWRDYVNQYWHANPACHQYRAGVDMLPEERKVHRSRLSRMKIIAEFLRDNYNSDQDSFEADFASCIVGDLTVNRILAEIRKRKRA
ncbi:Integrase-like, catalytic domain [Phytophthora cactorum]|nr:Integrase-like, catalytic domain [Phytophthora cactorum]